MWLNIIILIFVIKCKSSIIKREVSII